MLNKVDGNSLAMVEIRRRVQESWESRRQLPLCLATISERLQPRQLRPCQLQSLLQFRSLRRNDMRHDIDRRGLGFGGDGLDIDTHRARRRRDTGAGMLDRCQPWMHVGRAVLSNRASLCREIGVHLAMRMRSPP